MTQTFLNSVYNEIKTVKIRSRFKNATLKIFFHRSIRAAIIIPWPKYQNPISTRTPLKLTKLTDRYI